jgi:hypothetical protein
MEQKETYKFKGDTISLEGWHLRFDKERYRNVWAGEDLARLIFLCESEEEMQTIKDFIEFKNTITDRQFEAYLKEQQGG